MELHKKIRVVARRKKRLGRGLSSGRGKTSGRGTKGQKARSKVRADFEGGQTRLIKRLPLRRGIGNSKITKKPLIINLKYLNILPKGSVVNLDLLIKSKIVEENQAYRFGVKILGDGKLNFPLTIAVPISHSAKAKIEKAGGKIEFSEEAIEKIEKTDAKSDQKRQKNKNKVGKNIKNKAIN